MAIPMRNTTGDFLALVTPYTWTDPTVAENFTQYGDVEVQIVGISGTFTPYRSLDGLAWDNCNATRNGTAALTITADGNYSIPGFAFIKLTGATATRVTIRAAS